MLYSFQCDTGSALAVDSAGAVSCFDGTTTTPVVSVLPVSLQPAGVDPVTGFTDGAVLGWGVAAAMVAAWAVHSLRRAL